MVERFCLSCCDFLFGASSGSDKLGLSFFEGGKAPTQHFRVYPKPQQESRPLQGVC
jgi:hypothetical protein